MIQAVIFDIGGVFSRFENRPNLQTWAQNCKLEPDALGEMIFGPAAEDAYTGRTPEGQHWQNIGQKLGLNLEQSNQLRLGIYGDFVWDLGLLEYARALRPRYKTAVLSSAFSNVRTEIAGWVNETIFDTLVYSAEVGLNKPDAEIYRCALSRLEVPAEYSVFIDDRPENVEGARAVGMMGILFSSSEQLRRDLNAMLSPD